MTMTEVFDEARANEARASVWLDGETRSDPLPDRPRNIEPREIIRRIGMPVLVNERGRHVCPVCMLDFEHAQSLGPHMRHHWQEAGVKLSDVPSVKAGRTTCPECGVATRRASLSAHLSGKHGKTGPEANGIARVYGFDLDAYLNPPTPAPVDRDEERRRSERERKAKYRNLSYEERQQQYVVCPHGECGAVQRRKQIHKHLRSIHQAGKDESLKVARELPASAHRRPVASKLPYKGNRVGTGGKKVEATTAVAVAPEIIPTTIALDFTAIAPSDIAIGVVQSQINGSIPTALLPDVIEYIDRTRELVAKLRAVAL